MLSDFDDIIADAFKNKNHDPVVTKLFRRCKKLHIYLFFIQDGLFWGCLRTGGRQKDAPSIKYVTHILQ